MPPAETGNASNPSSSDDQFENNSDQLIDKRGEKYLKEISNIEDLPDDEDQQKMDDSLKDPADHS